MRSRARRRHCTRDTLRRGAPAQPPAQARSGPCTKHGAWTVSRRLLWGRGSGAGARLLPVPVEHGKDVQPRSGRAHRRVLIDLRARRAAPYGVTETARRHRATLWSQRGGQWPHRDTHARAPTPVHGRTFSRPASRPAADDQAATGSRPPPFEKTNESGSSVTPDCPALPPKNAPHCARIATTAHTGLRPARRCSAEAGAFRGVRKVVAVGRDSNSTSTCARGSLCRNATRSPAIRETWLPGTLSGVASVASGAGRERVS
jgi:hypothetical protein